MPDGDDSFASGMSRSDSGVPAQVPAHDPAKPGAGCADATTVVSALIAHAAPINASATMPARVHASFCGRTTVTIAFSELYHRGSDDIPDHTPARRASSANDPTTTSATEGSPGKPSGA